MTINPFKLERFFGRYEFSTKYLLSSSDCEGLQLSELLAMASPESLLLWDNLKLGYTESPGHPLLRQSVSRGYANIKPDDVLIAVPEELIFVAMHTLLRPGDHVVAVAPTYQSLYEIALSIGCSLTPWQLEPGAQGWTLDIEKLESLITPQSRLLVINFPNNPTGFLPTPEQFDKIISVAQKYGLFVFSDEMYRLLEPDPTYRLPSVADIYERGMSLSGLSKSFALPGLRIGWLTTRHPALIEEMIAFKDYTTICNSAPSEILAIIALQNAKHIISRNLEIIRVNSALAEDFFRKHAQKARWIAPQAGSIAFPKWLGQEPVEQFCQDLLDKKGVMIVPGSIFDYDGHFRIGLGRKNFAEALEHLDEYFNSHS